MSKKKRFLGSAAPSDELVTILVNRKFGKHKPGDLVKGVELDDYWASKVASGNASVVGGSPVVVGEPLDGDDFLAELERIGGGPVPFESILDEDQDPED